MALGSHSTKIVNEKINVSMGIIISGKVLSARDFSPIKNVKISHWQENSHNQYQDYLRAFMFTDINGKFKFSTQWVGEDKIKKIIFFIVLTKKDKLN